VRILVHPEPIHVSYQTVRDLVPQLWDLDGTIHPGRPRIDAVIHIGMAGPQLCYSVEHRGHRDGYALKDVDDQFLRDQDRRLREGKKWVWDGCPVELFTDLNLDDVLSRWKSLSPVC
jgi:pyroglutamyl-peptidase